MYTCICIYLPSRAPAPRRSKPGPFSFTPLSPHLLLLISLFSLFPRSLLSCLCRVSVFFFFVTLKPRVE